ncbi:MAG TPA: phosphatase domain-containing protein [Alphaproteobacteria bacterium]|nr:phosphatase domain-containing protein [Alphaproteobacteria bacterium]
MAEGTWRRWRRAVARILDLLARPVRTAQGGRGDVVLQPYRGYGSRREVFVIGRVFRQSAPEHGTAKDDIAGHLRDIGRRIARRAIADATVTARFCGAEQRVETDRDGYFRIAMAPAVPPPDDRTWHSMELTVEGAAPVRAEAPVFIPPGRCRFVVISDIDDTVMYTGVTSKLGMLWRLFVQDAHERVPFPGVSALYRALHCGATGGEENPMLYVSRAPWGIYEILEAFFRMHEIPSGPVLFLREWGISWRSPLPRKAEDHKRSLIANMLALYGDLPFVLIGDSGQHDPEVYRQIVEANPGRVLAVLIRNVSRDPARIAEIERLAMTVAAAGSTLLLAADSRAMAEQAERLGLVPPGTAAEVAAAMARREGPKGAAGTHRIRRATGPATAAAVAEGAVRTALGTDGQAPEGQEAPPNVVVEGERRPGA